MARLKTRPHHVHDVGRDIPLQGGSVAPLKKQSATNVTGEAITSLCARPSHAGSIETVGAAEAFLGVIHETETAPTNPGTQS